jgi:predicted ATP-grasp superfamily ATP-dependent carboligase
MPPPPTAIRPVLVTNPTSAGTLAAVRAFGRAGIPVAVGGSEVIAAAQWSRFVSARWPGGVKSNERETKATLTAWAARAENHVLLAASDAMAWMLAHYKTELSSAFTVYIPDAPVIDKILDKQQLEQVCIAANIPTLPTWFPGDSLTANALSDSLPYPILIKPRRHVFRVKNDKGFVVESPAALRARFAAIARREHDRTIEAETHPQPMPLLQRFIPDAVENIISVSGFIDRTGARTALRASRKILQRSRPVGIGLAFEAIPVALELAETAITLCKHLGYFGIFEIEFIRFENRWCVIDFNPRFFHQMALDMQSGAPLPLLAYHDACHNIAALDHAIAQSAAPPPVAHYGFRDAFTVGLMQLARALVGRGLPSRGLPGRGLPGRERKKLSMNWPADVQIIDAAFDRKDPLPWLIHAMSEIRLGCLAIPRLIETAWQSRAARPPIQPQESRA